MKIESSHETLGFWSNQAHSAIQGLKLYIGTLEDFIEAEKNAEIKAIVENAGEISNEGQSEFWAWHYPVHWEEIFATQLRSSFLVTLISLVESHISTVANEARAIARASLAPRELQGEHLERHRRYFEKVLAFDAPKSDLWNDMHDLGELRNRIVHAQSSAHSEDPKKQKRYIQLSKKFPGISVHYSVFQFSAQFPPVALERAEMFLTALYKEARRLIK